VLFALLELFGKVFCCAWFECCYEFCSLQRRSRRLKTNSVKTVIKSKQFCVRLPVLWTLPSEMLVATREEASTGLAPADCSLCRENTKLLCNAAFQLIAAVLRRTTCRPRSRPQQPRSDPETYKALFEN
jgi:hypothetical protein